MNIKTQGTTFSRRNDRTLVVLKKILMADSTWTVGYNFVQLLDFTWKKCIYANISALL